VRSRIARACARVGVFVIGLLATVVTAGTASAQTVVVEASADSNPFDALSAPVGLTAIGLGMVGMLAGVFRRKKAAVQPENQRKVL
jgi:hypothetical protein